MSRALTWAHIRALALGRKRRLATANLLAITAVALSVPIPLLLPLLVDEVLLQQGNKALQYMDMLLPSAWQQATGYILLMLLVSLALRLASLWLSVLAVKRFAQLSKDIVYRIRDRLLAALEHISMREYESLGTGRVAAHLLTDVETLDSFLGDTLSRALVALLTLIGTSAILLWMHWQLALMILLLNPWVVFATIHLGKKVKWLKKQENDRTADFAQQLTETLEAMHELRASGRQRYFFARLNKQALEVRDASSEAKWKTEAAGRSSGVLFQFGIDIFRAAAMLTVLFSDLSIGQMLAVFSYLWFMIGPVEQLLSLQYGFYAASAALNRVNTLLRCQTEASYPAKRDPFSSQSVGIRFRGVHFRYANECVFKNLSFTINPGERVAIVGASGGGKSTLVQLLLGLYESEQGAIEFNDVPREVIGNDLVRQHVAVVLQHPAIFDDSVRANLCLGRTYTDQQCWNALQHAELADLIRDLPDGLDSKLGRFGVKLSGGQRQRLAIARILLSDAKVVIMDEATSALDTVTEQKVLRNLEAFFAGRTVIIIAHRLSAILSAERILVLHDGALVQSGTHHALLKQSGLYKDLYG